MINSRFKVGDRVKFTQEAKDRFEDSEYWHFANYNRIRDSGNLDKVYTVRSIGSGKWYSVYLGGGTAPHTPDYLLEPAETQKTMQKKDFILALVQALVPDLNITYTSCHPYAKVHIGCIDSETITVKCPKRYGNVWLTLSPMYGKFKETAIETVTKFLKQRCDLNSSSIIEVTDNGDLVMSFEDYPWHMVSEIKPLEQSPTKKDSEQVQALQAEIQQLKAENERLKAQTYTIEIPKGVTSICLNLKG